PLVHLVAAARHDARADQAAAIVVGAPEEGAAEVGHLDQVAVLGGALRLGHLVAEDPGVPGAQAAVLVLLEPQARRGAKAALRPGPDVAWRRMPQPMRRRPRRPGPPGAAPSRSAGRPAGRRGSRTRPAPG